MRNTKQASARASRLSPLAGVAAGVLIGYAASVVSGVAAESKGEKQPEKTEKKTEKKKLAGAELYAVHCGRCHPERYPTEFTASQWRTILIEMRVRANLPASQAKAILKYLQEDSGTP